jgi:hypothetical protein
VKKDMYSLKKIYESTFKTKYTKKDVIVEFQRKTFFNDIPDMKTLKDLYSKNNIPSNEDDVFNQKKTVEVTGLGAFNLTPIQVSLIGCINQYYFGDKKLALDLINILRNQKDLKSNESQLKNQFKKAINENEEIQLKKPDYRVKRNEETAKKFIKACLENKIIDKNFDIVSGQTISQSSYFISKASGYLFELFLCTYIQNNPYCIDFTTNYDDTIERLLGNKNVLYIASILSVIYNLTDFNSFTFNVDKDIVNNLYNNIFSHDKDIFENVISPELRSEPLYFKFDDSNAAIDIVVFLTKKEKDVVVSFIDLKTTTKSQSAKMNMISSNINSVGQQISLYKDNMNNRNFVIGNLKIYYSYEESLKINSISSNFIYANMLYEKIEETKDGNEYKFLLVNDEFSNDKEGILSLKSGDNNQSLVQLTNSEIENSTKEYIANSAKNSYISKVLERIAKIIESATGLDKKFKKNIIENMFWRLLPKDFIANKSHDRIKINKSTNNRHENSPIRKYFTNATNIDSVKEFYHQLYKISIDENSDYYQYALDIAYDIISQHYVGIEIEEEYVPEGFGIRKEFEEKETYEIENISIEDYNKKIIVRMKNAVNTAIETNKNAQYVGEQIVKFFRPRTNNRPLTNKKISNKKDYQYETEFFSKNPQCLSKAVSEIIKLIVTIELKMQEEDRFSFRQKIIKKIYDTLKIYYIECIDLLDEKLREEVSDKYDVKDNIESLVDECWNDFLVIKDKSKYINKVFNINNTNKIERYCNTFNKRPESLLIFYQKLVNYLLDDFSVINVFVKLTNTIFNLFENQNLNYFQKKEEATVYRFQDLAIVIFLHDVLLINENKNISLTYYNRFIKAEASASFKDLDEAVEEFKNKVNNSKNSVAMKLKIINYLKANQDENSIFVLKNLDENLKYNKKENLLREVYKHLFI